MESLIGVCSVKRANMRVTFWLYKLNKLRGFFILRVTGLAESLVGGHKGSKAWCSVTLNCLFW